MINESTYERNSYILGCRRMKGRHNYINIAKVITDITETYKLDHSKITHTVTDNASNFCKSFKTFSKPLPDVPQIDLYTFGNFNEDSDDSDAGSCSTADDEDTNLNLVDVNEYWYSQPQ